MVLDIAGRAQEIGELGAGGVAMNPGRSLALLCLVDRLEQYPAHAGDDDIGRAEMLLASVLDRALCFDRESVLRGEVEAHAAVALVALQFLPVLKIAILRAANVPFIGADILVMV